MCKSQKVARLPDQEVVGEGSEVLEMSEGVFAEALADYPGQELAWLQGLHEAHLRDAAPSQAALLPAGLLPAPSGSKTKARPCLLHALWTSEQPNEAALPAGLLLSGSKTKARACLACSLEPAFPCWNPSLPAQACSQPCRRLHLTCAWHIPGRGMVSSDE